MLTLLEGTLPVTMGKMQLRPRSCLGLMLLFLSAEVGRREATEGWLWQVVGKRRFGADVQTVLFTSGQPSAQFKAAVESAASDFRLRHVVGAAGLQRWMDTVYLQFGFTRQGFIRSLPSWLATQSGTVAVDMLLRGDLGSTSFQTLWSALQNYRRQLMSRERLMLTMASSPWILPGWAPEIATRAVASARGGEECDEDAASRPLLVDSLRLCWEGMDAPEFWCDLADVSRLDLAEDSYDLRLGGVMVARVVRQRDGRYRATGDTSFRISLDDPTILATLHDRRGTVVACEPVVLWDQEDDVTVIDLATGERLGNAWSSLMDPRRSYAMVVTSDLEVRPAVSVKRAVGRGAWTAYRLAAPWPSEVAVYLDGELLWTPSCLQRVEDEEPDWAQAVQASYLPDLGGRPDQVQVELWHEEDVQVRFVRVQGRTAPLTHRTPTATTTGPVRLLERRFSQRFEIRAGVERAGERVCISRRLDLQVPGLVHLSDDGYRAWEPSRALPVEVASGTSFKIVPPLRVGRELTEAKDWAVLEGGAWVTKPSVRWLPLRGLSGLGGPLVLRHGVYNARTPDICLAAEVHRMGCIREARVSPRQGELVLTLWDAIEPDPTRHGVRLWLADGGLVEARDIVADGRTWRVRSTHLKRGLRAALVSFRNVWLGCWWAPDWSRDLGELARADAERVARVLFLFRLPVMSSRHRRAVRRVAQAWATTFLPIWLDLLAPRKGGAAVEFVESWMGALRDIYRTWTPTPEQASSLIGEAFGPVLHSKAHAPRETLWQLAAVDPLLLGRVLLMWVTRQSGAGVAGRVLEQAYCLLAGKGMRHEADEQRRTLTRDVVGCMFSDQVRYRNEETFLERGILRVARDVLAGGEGHPADQPGQTWRRPSSRSPSAACWPCTWWTGLALACAAERCPMAPLPSDRRSPATPSEGRFPVLGMAWLQARSSSGVRIDRRSQEPHNHAIRSTSSSGPPQGGEGGEGGDRRSRHQQERHYANAEQYGHHRRPDVEGMETNHAHSPDT